MLGSIRRTELVDIRWMFSGLSLPLARSIVRLVKTRNSLWGSKHSGSPTRDIRVASGNADIMYVMCKLGFEGKQQDDIDLKSTFLCLLTVIL